MPVNKLCSILLIAFAALALMAAEKKPWKDASISVGDIRVHYIEAGTGDHSLVFIPGWTMTAEVWKEQIPYFASRNFRQHAAAPHAHLTHGGDIAVAVGIDHVKLAGCFGHSWRHKLAESQRPGSGRSHPEKVTSGYFMGHINLLSCGDHPDRWHRTTER